MRTSNLYQTIRIWTKTHRRLRIIAAHTGESIVEVLDRLARQEYRRLHLPEPVADDAREQLLRSPTEEG